MLQRSGEVKVLDIEVLDKRDRHIRIVHSRIPEFDREGLRPAANSSLHAFRLIVRQGFNPDHPKEPALYVDKKSEHTEDTIWLGSAWEHGVKIGLFGVSVEGISIASDLPDIDTSSVEHGNFELGFEPAPVFSGQLIVPLAGGRLTLGISQAEMASARQTPR